MELFLGLIFFIIFVSIILSFFIFNKHHRPSTPPQSDSISVDDQCLRLQEEINETANRNTFQDVCDKLNDQLKPDPAASTQCEFVIEQEWEDTESRIVFGLQGGKSTEDQQERPLKRYKEETIEAHFSLHGGERTEAQEIEKEKELGCRRVFFKHRHPYTVKKSVKSNTIKEIDKCHKCNYLHQDFSVGCLECTIHLHPDCATKGFPLNIRHIYHPFHRLSLKAYDSNGNGLTRCNACYKKVWPGKFMFDCKSCNYHLCIPCSLLKPNIKDKRVTDPHHHLFTFFPKSTHNFIHEYCKFCGDRCDGDDFIVRCVNCDFNLHLHCFPSLPTTIKHRFHMHILTLITDSNLVESDKGYDDEDIYCDICEKIRDRKHQVYCCNKCKIAAHVNCVASEVLSLIRLQGSELTAATTTMLEQSDIQDCRYPGHITGNKGIEIVFMRKFTRGCEKSEDGNPQMDEGTIQPVLYYLTNTIGDETLAREFLEKRKVEEINRENDDTQIDSPELVALNEKIEELYEGITKQTKVLESVKESLKDLNAELEKVEAQRAKLLRPQQYAEEFNRDRDIDPQPY